MTTLCILLWARDGCADDLTVYEHTALELVEHHGGTVHSRVRCAPTTNGPDEIHVLEFRDTAALDAYMSDPRRHDLADERNRVVARTDVLDAELLTARPSATAP